VNANPKQKPQEEKNITLKKRALLPKKNNAKTNAA
jgi:hypothetical protein